MFYFRKSIMKVFLFLMYLLLLLLLPHLSGLNYLGNDSYPMKFIDKIYYQIEGKIERFY